MKHIFRGVAVVALSAISLLASAQKYHNGIIDKTIAVVGNEVIMISQLEQEVQMMKAYGMMSDKSGRSLRPSLTQGSHNVRPCPTSCHRPSSSAPHPRAARS